ncbi:MAG: DUF3179 domain-containing protein [Chloroflexi bacterium]|nr:DUF3179 domain-containing protein [Chloroflexota bacterium]
MKKYSLLLVVGLALIGIVLLLKPEPPEGAPEATATAVPPTATITTATTPPANDQPANASPIADDEVNSLLNALARDTPPAAAAAAERILDANDHRFVSVFIELLRFRQLGLVNNLDLDVYASVLHELSGQSFGVDWPAWIEWYGNADLRPPPGFASWKGAILSQIDPGFGQFLRDSHPSNIRVEEIQWGGVRVDGIPALDNPPMLGAADAGYLAPEDIVFGLFINGEARAYPLRILDWHEMANDVVGGVPVSLAYCTLCGAAIAYDGRASDGDGEDAVYTFGSSGFLFRSNKLMYDRQTRTLWNQLTGRPVLGELVSGDVALDILPVVLTTWEAWRDQHPDTLVLDIETGHPRDYTPGAAYGNYFVSEETMFPIAQRSDALDDKAQVYVIRLEGVPKAYPIDILIEEHLVNDTLGATNVVLIAPGEALWVNGDNQYVGEVMYRAGGEIRAYDRGDETFTLNHSGRSVTDSSGKMWQITEDALIGPDGQTAPRLSGHLAYWFGWYAFFPNTLVYDQ